MLNRNACKVCVATSNNDWDDVDDESWQEGMVSCPPRIFNGWRPIDEPPPKNCPYRLEHLMSKETR